VTAGSDAEAGPARLRERPGLLAVAVGLPVAELAVLWAIGLPGDRVLVPQVTAPSPIAEYHDLRWLMLLQTSWVTLALESAGALFVRSLINAVIVHQAWAGPRRPSFTAIWRRTAAASLVLGIFIAPWAAIAFGVDMVSISWLTFAAVPPIIAVALASPHGPISGRWWRQAPPARAVGWVVLVVVETTACGAVIGALPAPAWVPVAAAGGLVNAWAWRGVVGAVTGREAAHRRFLPVAPAVAVGMVGVAVAGTAISFALVTRHPVRPPPPPGAAGEAAAGGPPVLVVGGFGTSWDGTSDPSPLPGPFTEQRFSYRGMGRRGTPLGYGAAATHQSLDRSVHLMAGQVAALQRRDHRPVDIVAESEGELIARLFVAAYPEVPVDHLILLSPLDQPGRVYYPVAGHRGYGFLSGYELRGLTDLLGGISPVDLPADSPFLRSIADHAADLRDLLSCPSGAAHEELIAPLADAVADPANPGRIPTIILPAFHGGLLSDPQARADVAALLEGHRRLPVTPGLGPVETTVRLVAAPWQEPPLPLSLFPTAGSDQPSCATMATHVRQWIRGA
jgi:hypothetical protein